MKQTNNAIKFLMAQYRAIFKNANIAMVAAMAAAALAAGSANAADLSSKLTNSVDTAVDVTSTAADDTITVAGGKNYAKTVTVNKGAQLTVSGHLAAVGDVTVNGGTLILKDDQSSLMLGAIKDVSSSIKNKQHYEHNLKVTAGSDIQMKSANIGVANFDIAGSTISLKSGGAGGTNLTAYGAGAYQNDAHPANLSYNAIGKLTDVKATLEGGTNITAIGHLDIKGSAQDKSVINLQGMASGSAGHADSLAYIGGSKKLTIDNTTINVKDGSDKSKSKGTAVVSPDLQITNSKIVIAAANDTLTLGGLADRNSVGGTSGLQADDYTADTATIKNSNISITGGTLNLGHEANTLQTKTSFNLTGNTITNAGTINAYGNVTVDTVAGLYGANGTLNLSGSTLTVTGAQAIDLSDTNAKIKADAGSTFKAENANVTIGNGFESKVPKLVAGTLTVKGEVSAAPDASYQNRPFLVIQSGDVTALNEVKGSPKNTEIAVYNKTSGGSATLTLGNAQTTNGKLTDIARVYVGVGQDGKDSTNTLNVNGEWDFANAKLAVGNNGTLNINEGAEVSNIERLQIHGNNVAAKNTINIDGILNLQRLLAAESQTTSGDEINVKGTFNITGDGKTETKGESGKYANDVQLTKATLNIKAGGTVSLATKDAWDDVLKVTTNSDTDITTFEVQATGGNTTDFGGWDKTKVNLAAGGTLRIDLSDYKVENAAALDTLAAALMSTSSKGLVDFGKVSFATKLETNNDGSIDLDKMPSVKTEATQNLEVNLGTTTSLNKSYSMGSANVSGNSLTVADGSTLEFNNAKNGQFATNTAASGGSSSKVNVTLAANSAVNLNGDGSLGDIKKNGSDAGTVAVLGGKNGTQTVGVVDVAIFNQVGGNVTTGAITATDIDVNGVLNAGGTVTTTTLNIAGGAINAAGKDITVSGADSADIFGDVVAGSLSLSGGATIAGGADVNLGTLNLSGGKILNVGRDGEDGSTATVFTDKLVMGAGSTIFVDPSYDDHATVLATKVLTDTSASDVNVSNGNIKVGKNAAFGIGFDQAEFDSVMANYLVDGKFTDPVNNQGYANAFVLNSSLTIKSGTGVSVKHDLKDTDSVTSNGITLGERAALIITDKAFGADKQGTAITFGKTGETVTTATVTADPSSVISLVGDFDAKDTNLKIFAATGGTVTNAGVKVQALGGMLEGNLTSGTLDKLELSDNAKILAYAGVSRPVGDFFLGLALGDYVVDSTQAGHKFVTTVTQNAGGFKVVDTAAHAATYAGAQQAAVASVTTMADAMFGRVGAVGVEAASISATGSQANGGVWLTPMYKSMDSDGFNAEGASYGSDVDLGGVAFGADTVNGNMRFGAVFNIGSGDSEGKGQGNGLKDEFDYYGFGIYSAMGFGNLALVGDASMTVISHDVEGLGLRGKADTTAVTMGITGQYTVATPTVDVTPHLGARFI
ncbi:hypothetical protein, partial [Anaerobiospirillum succiniciproducens]|uniref:hypothetical protein n=1 Tax=Anaerobiospirillum succiniciproducens TaxID=13335 RepID=UPI002941DA1B